jgi:glutathione S-transferase
MIELYHFWDSPCCFKVRLALAEKQIKWKPHLIASVQFDHFKSGYQALNPHSIVPTLIHGDHVLFQSGVIVEYLDEIFPDISLIPDNSWDRAIMRQWTHDEQAYLFPLIITMSFNLMMTLRVEAYGMDQLREWSKQHPDQSRAKDYLDRISSPIDREAVEAATMKFAWHMERLEKQMDILGGPWVLGESYSLADISLGPILDRIEYLDLLKVLDKAPRVADWFERIKARPAFYEAAPSFEYRMWGPKKPIPESQVSPNSPYGTFPSH